MFSDVNFSPQLLAILEAITNRGAEVLIILIGDTNLQIARQIQTYGWKFKIIRARGKYKSLINLIFVAAEMFRFRPRTLFASGQFATIIGLSAAKFLNLPKRVFIRHHSNFHHKFNLKFGRSVDQLCNHLATTIVAVSEVVKQILLIDEGVPPNKVTVIHNGVHLDEFKSKELAITESNEKENCNSSLFHIGVISRLTEWKGVQYTATAFVKLQKEFPEARLHIVGASSDSYMYVKVILSEAQSGTYTFYPVHSNVPNFLQELNVFVHTPVGPDDEAFGIVYIEALASGIQCIFTKSGVLHEMQNIYEYAHIVDFSNSEDIYVALKKLITGMQNNKTAIPQSLLAQFSLDLMATKYADLLLNKVR